MRYYCPHTPTEDALTSVDKQVPPVLLVKLLDSLIPSLRVVLFLATRHVLVDGWRKHMYLFITHLQFYILNASATIK